MRVLLIDVNCKWSSTGKIVYDLYTSLNSRNDTVGICYGRGLPVQGQNIYKFGVDFETYFHAAMARLTGYNGCFSYFSTKRLLNYIEEFKPDIIHLHELHAYFVNIKPLINYIKQHRIPLVWTFHCEYMYTGKCGHAYDCEKWKTECGHCTAITDYPKSMFLDRTRSMYNQKKKMLHNLDFTIITPSQWLADRVKQSFLHDKTIKVIHNGIDTDGIFYIRDKSETEALRRQFNIDKRKIILSVAPNIMDEKKGGMTVLELSKALTDIQFVLVGTDQDKKYSDNVLMIKRTNNQDELAKWYSLADLFLICSKRENFPTTCLEALSCGTPIVGIDAGGTKETAPKPYGYFVKGGGTLDLLQKGIRTQLNADFVRSDIRNAAVKMYSKKVMCDAYYELYQSIMNFSAAHLN